MTSPETSRNEHLAKNLILQPEDLEGLPDALLAELSNRYKPNEVRDAILNAIGTGEASVDQILIRVYRSTGKVLSRNTIVGHAFRFRKEGLLVSTDGGYRKAQEATP